MKLLRQLEMRIESLLDGAAGLVFRGPLHPLELVSKLMREADLHTRPGAHGLLAPNLFSLGLHGDHSTTGAGIDRIVGELERLVDLSAFERGWRMPGPTKVTVHIDPTIGHGTVTCVAEIVPGPRPAWAGLRAEESFPVTVNQAVVGRDTTSDVVLANDTISRRHALVWTEAGQTFVRDLGSANGTEADGAPVGATPVEIGNGSIITLGEAGYRFEDLLHA